jgi:hypothetical protein
VKEDISKNRWRMWAGMNRLSEEGRLAGFFSSIGSKETDLCKQDEQQQNWNGRWY